MILIFNIKSIGISLSKYFSQKDLLNYISVIYTSQREHWELKEEINDMFYGASWIIHKQARELRHRETESEKILWSYLSNRKMTVKFRRQHPINQFIADFYSQEIKLIIELDGPYHFSTEKMDYDNDRTRLFNDFNIKVIRFTNYQVLNNIKDVLEEIRKIIEDLSEEKNIPGSANKY